MQNWEALFDERFFMDYDNGPQSHNGLKFIHRLNDDGSCSFATLDDFKRFIRTKVLNQYGNSAKV